MYFCGDLVLSLFFSKLILTALLIWWLKLKLLMDVLANKAGKKVLISADNLMFIMLIG